MRPDSYSVSLMVALYFVVVNVWCDCATCRPARDRRTLQEECNGRFHFNVTRTTLSGLASYRSSLTLDGLAAEDVRQKAMVDLYEDPPLTQCHEHPAPSPRKVGRYILKMLRKLEGDHEEVIKEFIQTLVHSKILVEVSSYETEPDLDSLVKSPEVLRAEPHTTFPRVMALVWMAITDAENAERNGWCSIDKVSRFLRTVEPSEVPDHLRSLNIVMGRARMAMENFIQHFSALNIIYKSRKPVKLLRKGIIIPTLTTNEVIPSTTNVSTTEEVTIRSLMPVRYETLVHCSSYKISAAMTPVFIIVHLQYFVIVLC